MTSTVTNSRRPRPLKLFRFKDAPILEETDMMTPATVTEEIQQIDLSNLQPGVGYEARVLFADDEVEDGLSLVHAWFAAGYPLPTHTHNADCLYYIVRGSAILGKNVLEAGDGFFVPSGAAYRYEAGPDGVEVLEMRTATKWDMVITDQNVDRWKANAARADEHREEWLEAHKTRPLQ